jgi:pimeloyl-ACP methyl ester carboxylesterase
MDKFAQVNDIRLHYLDRPGGDPPLLLLPGLTANAHAFDGLIAAGLSPRFRTLAVDFRGRGLSDKPESGYSMDTYAADMIALLNTLGINEVIACGHSFGALIGMILAAQQPERFPKLVVIDSSPLLITERTVKMVKESLDRLGKTLPSLEAYISAMKGMPYLNGFWNESLERFYRHDVQVNEDDTVQAHAAAHAIDETIEHEYAEPWEAHIDAIEQPVLLLNATEPYGPPEADPILPEEMARETAAMFTNCDYRPAPGNHITMLFGDNASHVVEVITEFVEGK